MKIIVNGKEMSLPEDSNIQDLVAQLGCINKRIAIEINKEIIPKSKYQSHLLEYLDKVEVINAVGGG
ncbi:sulfur carrier protein ThiS [Candidatus Thioglobus sp.]|nr:sulfur carrier protein ThiS [Candidatus Thioglobus sp.]